jgi:hypothetical protein
MYFVSCNGERGIEKCLVHQNQNVDVDSKNVTTNCWIIETSQYICSTHCVLSRELVLSHETLSSTFTSESTWFVFFFTLHSQSKWQFVLTQLTHIIGFAELYCDAEGLTITTLEQPWEGREVDVVVKTFSPKNSHDEAKLRRYLCVVR